MPVFDFGDAEMKPDFIVTLENEAPAVMPILVCAAKQNAVKRIINVIKREIDFMMICFWF